MDRIKNIAELDAALATVGATVVETRQDARRIEYTPGSSQGELDLASGWACGVARLEADYFADGSCRVWLGIAK